MKKTLFICAVAVLALTSCKKDRKCHCRTVTDYYDTAGTKLGTTTTERDIVMEKTTRKTAFNGCIHQKAVQNYPSGSKMVEQDDYCELK